MAEQDRAALAQERDDLVVEGVPLEQRRERGRRVRERPFHVRHPRAGGDMPRGDVAGRWSRGGLVERLDPGHERHDATDVPAPLGG